MIVKAAALCLAFYGAKVDTKALSSHYDWKSRVVTLSFFIKKPILADDLLNDDKVVIEQKTIRQLAEKPLEFGTYRVVGYGDLPQTEIRRLKKNYGITARKVTMAPQYPNDWTYTIGFGDIEFIGRNIDIQKYLTYQGKHPDHIRIISIDKNKPTEFMDIMTDLFYNAPQDPWMPTPSDW